MIFRFFDIAIALVGFFVMSPIFLLVIVLGFLETGRPIFLQPRIGMKKKLFILIKFRTMKVGTESVASHLAHSSSVTDFGRFLRKYKIDEFPQLINVLKGDMSIVGPRPNLQNQIEVIAERESLGVYDVRPGITGLSQVQKIDMSTPNILAKTDKKMIQSLTVMSYFKYILLSVIGRGGGDRVKR